MINVQFGDATKAKIVTVFNSPQDPGIWENLGKVAEADPRYLSFIESMEPTLEALAASKRDSLLSVAALRIDPLQDAIDLGSASVDEKEALNLWKKYRVEINRVYLQEGFPGAIDWPQTPE